MSAGRVLLAVVMLLAGCGGGKGDVDGGDTVQADALPLDAGRGDSEGADAGPVGPEAPPMRELVGHVDPLIGTDGAGNSIPGPQLPHGMVKLSPDSVREVGQLFEYEYEEEGRLWGFSHTHFQGPGGSGYGYNHLLVTPVTGRPGDVAGDLSSALSHESETAQVGYYAVTLDDFGVEAELAATHRAGLHRYTFPTTTDAEIRLNLGHSGGECLDAHVVFIPPDVVSGWARFYVWPIFGHMGSDQWGSTSERTVYFRAQYSVAPEEVGTWSGEEFTGGSHEASGNDIGIIARFTTMPAEPVLFKLGLSLISEEQAAANLAAEIPAWDFEAVVAQAEDAWNQVLNKVVVDGEEEDLGIFYSALYRAHIEPVDYSEGDRAWVGPGGEGTVVDLAEGERFFADDWCLWDTFRTSHPLATLLEPDTCRDVANSFLRIYDQGGWLPKCPWQATGYSRAMIGNHAIPVLADILLKGIPGIDADKALEAMVKSQSEDSTEPDEWPFMCGYVNLGTPAEYRNKGYISQDCDQDQSVSMTLEYAFDDWCVARVAEMLDKTALRAEFDQRAGFWANHWDESTGFLRPRMKDGSWLEPFDPLSGLGFCEADAWKYLWFVPHDVPGLIETLGGAEAFVARLDEFFAQGHYTADNQPDFHVPYLYNFAGRPDRTQQVVGELVRTEFTAAPDGLPGNDDAGSTSAWYLFSALGFYPVCPAGGRYELTAPLFDRAVLRLDPDFHTGKAFVIETERSAGEDRYIQSMTLNGEPLDRTWIAHDEITAGGVLHVVLSDSPGTH